MTEENILKEHNEELLNQVLKLQKEVYLLKTELIKREVKNVKEKNN